MLKVICELAGETSAAVDRPFSISNCDAPVVPCTCIVIAPDSWVAPPTSWLFAATLTPGISAICANGDRPVGSLSISSRSITRCWVALCTSTIGDSPVTVMVSSTAPTRRSVSTVAVKVPVNWMPSRLTVLNPGSVNVTV